MTPAFGTYDVLYVNLLTGSDGRFNGKSPVEDGFGNGPVRSIQQALYFIAQLRQSGNMMPVTVRIVGDYYTDKDIDLSAYCTHSFSMTASRTTAAPTTSSSSRRTRHWEREREFSAAEKSPIGRGAPSTALPAFSQDFRRIPTAPTRRSMSCSSTAREPKRHDSPRKGCSMPRRQKPTASTPKPTCCTQNG